MKKLLLVEPRRLERQSKGSRSPRLSRGGERKQRSLGEGSKAYFAINICVEVNIVDHEILVVCSDRHCI